MIQLPDYCEWCGAFLQGGATIHKDDCFIKKLIEENFPGKEANDQNKMPQMREKVQYEE